MRFISAAPLALLVVALAAPALTFPAAVRAASPMPAGRVGAVVDVPQLRTRWTATELNAACAQGEQQTDERLRALVAVPDAQRTFRGTFEALDRAVADFNEGIFRLSFMGYIHPDKDVRDAAMACEERAGKYGVALGARKDLYLAMKGYLAHAGTKDALDAEQQRLVELTMLDFKRNGLMLSDAQRTELVALRSRLTELQTRFQKNLNEDKTSFEVQASDLAGLPEAFVQAHAHPTKPGVCVLTTKYPDYYPVMENARNEDTRKAMEVAFMNRGGAENIKLLDEALVLRQKASKLLGYASHVDYVAEDRMARTSSTVESFLTRMRKGLAPVLDSDRKKMQALKAADTGSKTATIHAWDWRRYMNQIKQKDYAIDDEKVRAYFPTDKVMAGMFQVYAQLFGISIVEVVGAEVWADGVKLFEMRDADQKTLVARFYVDMYPREGKYGHAAEFTLSPGRATDGGYRIPMAALVVNFQPPQPGKAAYLSMNEVDTLFHEFGHVVHETLTVARYASQAGTNTARDFVEAPSQMLENWAYQPEVLALISSDPADPKKPLPLELAHKLAAARKYNAGVHYSRQVFLGAFDHTIHTAPGAPNSDVTAKRLWAEIMGFPEDPSAHFAGTFGHMMGGYDGGYYGYLWSEVFAADMFTRFKAEGVLNAKTGRAYRDLVIARGRTVEPAALLEDFLGRKPDERAFLTALGLAPAP